MPNRWSRKAPSWSFQRSRRFPRCSSNFVRTPRTQMLPNSWMHRLRHRGQSKQLRHERNRDLPWQLPTQQVLDEGWHFKVGYIRILCLWYALIHSWIGGGAEGKKIHLSNNAISYFAMLADWVYGSRIWFIMILVVCTFFILFYKA